MGNKQGEQQHDNLHSYAHSAGKQSDPSHSNICCAVSHSYGGSWIIDTGASDHMTSDLTQLRNLKPLPKHIHITLPDGSLKTVTQASQIHLFSELTMHNVLVLDFKFNLLSVNRLLSDLKMLTLFLPDHCVIHDLSTRRVIVFAHSIGELYKFFPITYAGTNNATKNHA